MLLHFPIALHKNMIDGEVADFFRTKSSESPVGTVVRSLRYFLCLDKMKRVRFIPDDLNRLILFIGIEISHHDRWRISCDVLYFLKDDLSAFRSCHFSNVIEMRIEDVEYFSCLLVLSLCPGYDASDRSIPALATGNGWRLR